MKQHDAGDITEMYIGESHGPEIGYIQHFQINCHHLGNAGDAMGTVGDRMSGSGTVKGSNCHRCSPCNSGTRHLW